jgi:hypothetical protein
VLQFEELKGPIVIPSVLRTSSKLSLAARPLRSAWTLFSGPRMALGI